MMLALPAATDVAGLVGVGLMLVSYAGVQAGRLDARGLTGLLMNLIGSCLVLYSLSADFNLSAAIMEGAWALIAAYGLIRLALRR